MKKIRIALLSLVVSFAIFIIIINLFKGPTLTVTNCNEKVFTGSKVCCNADGYYYIGNKGSIVHIDNEGKSNILYYEKENFKYIACNAKYIYAAYEQILVQFSLNGDIIKRIDNFSDKKSYTDIIGFYADDNGLLCADLSCYLILNPDTLEDLRLIDYMDNPQKTSFGDIRVCSHKKIASKIIAN